MTASLPASLYIGLGPTGGRTLQALHGMLHQLYGRDTLYVPLRHTHARVVDLYSPVNFLHIGTEILFEPSIMPNEAVDLALPLAAVTQNAIAHKETLHALTELPAVKPWVSRTIGSPISTRVLERLALFYDMQHTHKVLTQIKDSLAACTSGTGSTEIRVSVVAALDEAVGGSLLIDTLYMIQLAAQMLTRTIRLEFNVFLIVPSAETLPSAESDPYRQLQAALHEIARFTQTCTAELPYPIRYPGLEGNQEPFIMPKSDRFYYVEHTPLTTVNLAHTLLATLDKEVHVPLLPRSQKPDSVNAGWRLNTLHAQILALPIQAMADEFTQNFLHAVLRDTLSKPATPSKLKLVILETPLWKWLLATSHVGTPVDLPGSLAKLDNYVFGNISRDDLRTGSLEAPPLKDWQLRLQDAFRKPNETLQQACDALLDQAEELVSKTVRADAPYSVKLSEALQAHLQRLYEALTAIAATNEPGYLLSLRDQLQMLDTLLAVRLREFLPNLSTRQQTDSILTKLNSEWEQHRTNFTNIRKSRPSNGDLYEQVVRFCRITNNVLDEARIYQLKSTLYEILSALESHLHTAAGHLTHWLDTLIALDQESVAALHTAPVLPVSWQPEYLQLLNKYAAQMRKTVTEQPANALNWKWISPQLAGTSATLSEGLMMHYGDVLTAADGASDVLKAQAASMFEPFQTVLDVFDLIEQHEQTASEQSTQLITFLGEAAISPVRLATPKAGAVAAQLLLPVLNRPSEQRQHALDRIQKPLLSQFDADCQPYAERGWLAFIVNRRGIAIGDIPILNSVLKANPVRARQHAVFPAEQIGARYEKMLNCRLSPLALRLLEPLEVLETLIQADAVEVLLPVRSDDEFLRTLQALISGDERAASESGLQTDEQHPQSITHMHDQAHLALLTQFGAIILTLQNASDVPAEFQETLRNYAVDSALGNQLHRNIAEIVFWTRYLIHPLTIGTNDSSIDIAKVKHAIINDWIQAIKDRTYHLLANNSY